MHCSLFLIKVLGEAFKIYYTRPQHSCFPANFVKFLRTTYFIGHLQWLLFSILNETSVHQAMVWSEISRENIILRFYT